jgi:hypothetical protein
MEETKEVIENKKIINLANYIKTGLKNALIRLFPAVKFISIAVLCAFFVLVADIYYQVKNYADDLSKELNITVFFNKNLDDNLYARKTVADTGLVFEKEYVDSQSAYKKAVESNALLRDIVLADIEPLIPAYSVVSPEFLADDESLLSMKTIIENVSGVDEIVFDSNIFKRYSNIKITLNFYQKVLMIFTLAIGFFFICKCAFFIAEGKKRALKLTIDVIQYLLYSSFGFFCLWFLFVYAQHPLSIDDSGVLSAISFSAVLGVILD